MPGLLLGAEVPNSGFHTFKSSTFTDKAIFPASPASNCYHSFHIWWRTCVAYLSVPGILFSKFSSSIHITTNDRISFIYGEAIFHCTYTHKHTLKFLYIRQSTHSSVLYFGSSVVVSMRVQMYSTHWFLFLGHKPMSGIAGSCADAFSGLWRDIHTVLHNGCANLYAHQQLPFSVLIST